MQRRAVLAAGLGGFGLIAAGGTWRVTRMPDSAFEPWSVGDINLQDIRLHAFRHAILAPNPHNRQPWLIELVGENEAILSCDLAKRLPVTDPFDRQITIGFGTFLEIARIAAAEKGIALEAEMFPDGEAYPRLDTRPIARIKFGEEGSAEPDPLFGAIVHRRSNKQVYDLSRKVETRLLDVVVGSGGAGTNDPACIAELRNEILSAISIEMTTVEPHMESVELMRIGYREIAANPDGISLSGPMIEAALLAGQISREQLADMNSSTFKTGLDQMNETYGSVPALIWITTPSNTRADQIEAGRQYVRANLQAAALGLAMHPMSQSLQEYEEVSENFGAVHRLIGASGDERIQMLARVGYGVSIEPSPRWPVEKFVRLRST
ncbi:hypothetical protein [uncultured Erythrobacter sp.]|uniref:Acg family FMN-binding oxidoreductase n=1 Tax=uncultured Erythrobacter sp. TaxID=263913 RepID=UPI00262C5EC0|nr:hypothetical protein [uncultured Erythrobacter sp.]